MFIIHCWYLESYEQAKFPSRGLGESFMQYYVAYVIRWHVPCCLKEWISLYCEDIYFIYIQSAKHRLLKSNMLGMFFIAEN